MIPVGTKSVLWGAHCFFIHPFFLWAAWKKLYGPVRDWRLIVAFFLHDLGYWGKSAMDSDDGERHAEWAASVMRKWFGDEWGDFCLYHSRFYAAKHGAQFSKLCVADKLAMSLEPWWFYLPRVSASGEVYEYMALYQEAATTGGGKYGYGINLRANATMREWHADVQQRLYTWAYVNQYQAGKGPA